jgi:cytochrome b subunit of formate dehydrogenase
MEDLEAKVNPPRKRRIFLKALIWSTVVEIVVLAITGDGMMRSFFSHSSADPDSASNNPLAAIGMVFHIPSLIITAPLGLFILALLVQIVLMASIFWLFYRWLKSMGH